MAVARFEALVTARAAEALRGSLVEIDREALPALGEGEYYYGDLIGLAAIDRDGCAVARWSLSKIMAPATCSRSSSKAASARSFPSAPASPTWRTGASSSTADFLA